jgi:hypothetical protein
MDGATALTFNDDRTRLLVQGFVPALPTLRTDLFYTAEPCEALFPAACESVVAFSRSLWPQLWQAATISRRLTLLHATSFVKFRMDATSMW